MNTPAPHWTERIPPSAWLAAAAAFVALQALVLLAMGQPAICACGTVKLWHGLASSPETSQHLADWYTYSHVIHGFAFYLLLWLVAPRLPVGVRFALAIGIEAGWEIVENTPFIIERYREQALARGYSGDSVVNSIFDTLAAGIGFLLARLLPVWATVAMLIGIELFLAYLIRDNLTLNVIQLMAPSETISRWQEGG